MFKKIIPFYRFWSRLPFIQTKRLFHFTRPQYINIKVLTNDPDQAEVQSSNVKSMEVYKVEVALDKMRYYKHFLEKCKHNTTSLPPDLQEEFDEYLGYFKLISNFKKFYVLVAVGVSTSDMIN